MENAPLPTPPARHNILPVEPPAHLASPGYPTYYEVVLDDNGHVTPIFYSCRKTRSALLQAGGEIGDALVALLDERGVPEEFESLSPEAWVIGEGIEVRFSGRTLRDVLAAS